MSIVRVLFVLLLLNCILLYHGQLPETPLADPALNLTFSPSSQKIIIILAPFRGGSTLLGKIFDSNPHVQYLFEPFQDQKLRFLYRNGFIAGAEPRHSESELRMLYLQQIAHNCSVYPTPFIEKYAYCGTEAEHVKRFGTSECDRKFLDHNLAPGVNHRAVCRLREATVLKVIRMKTIDDLFKIKQVKLSKISVILGLNEWMIYLLQ